MRAPEGMISRTHVVELKSKFVANDLDLVESRSLHACLPDKFENDADGAKTAWRVGFRTRLKDLLVKEASGQLKPMQIRRPVYKVTANPEFIFFIKCMLSMTLNASCPLTVVSASVATPFPFRYVVKKERSPVKQPAS